MPFVGTNYSSLTKDQMLNTRSKSVCNNDGATSNLLDMNTSNKQCLTAFKAYLLQLSQHMDALEQ